MEFKELISIAGYAIESIGVVVIIVGSMVSTFRFLSNFRKEPEGFAYGIFRRQLGRSIILGLEFLIAGDIIRTVIVADTLTKRNDTGADHPDKNLPQLFPALRGGGTMAMGGGQTNR